MNDYFRNLNKNQLLSIAIGVFLGSMVYLLLGGLFQQSVDQSVSNFSTNIRGIFQRKPEIIPSSPFRYAKFTFGKDGSVAPQPTTNLTNDLLLEDMYQRFDLSAEAGLTIQDLPRNSYAFKSRLVSKEAFTGFEWYQQEGQNRLYYNDELYTGWYQENGVLIWCDNGYLDLESSVPITSEISLATTYLPHILPNRLIYLDTVYDYTSPVWVEPVDDSLEIISDNLLILSNPAGTYNSQVIGTTATVAGNPLNVVEVAHTLEDTWLHVYSGYQKLGWIREDMTGASYRYIDYNERELLSLIQSVLIEEFAEIDAVIGGSFVNIDTMAQVDAYNQIIFPASTLKIYVLAEVYHQYKTGELDPEDVVIMEAEDKVPGAGNIQGMPDGTPFTINELVDLVVIYSDNTAANMLIDVVGGGERITPFMHQLGLYDTYVNGKYYSERNDRFYSTPHDAAKLFALLANDEINGDPWDDLLIDKFALNSHTFLRGYIGGETYAYNKSGLGETEQNDVANFYTPYGRYSLAVFTAYPANYDGIGAQVGTLSARVHEVFNEYHYQLYETYPDEEE